MYGFMTVLVFGIWGFVFSSGIIFRVADGGGDLARGLDFVKDSWRSCCDKGVTQVLLSAFIGFDGRKQREGGGRK